MAYNKRKNLAYGFSQPIVNVGVENITAKRAPTSKDMMPIGTEWVDNHTGNIYFITKITSGEATWLNAGGGSGTFSSLSISGDTTIDGTTTLNGLLEATDEVDINATSTVAIDSSGDIITIGADADDYNIALGTGGERDLLIGNTTGVTSVTVQSGTGGISLDSDGTGNIELVPATDSAAATSITLDAKLGAATFTGVTTASGAQETFTITNSEVSATSAIMVTVSNVGTDDARMSLEQVKPAAGSFEVMTQNNGGDALGDDVTISFHVLN